MEKLRKMQAQREMQARMTPFVNRWTRRSESRMKTRGGGWKRTASKT